MNGSAIIEVPEDFRIVSDVKGLTVQVTPMGEAATIWCVSKSLDKIELKASADVEFDYMVNGVRTMLKDRNPIFENTFFVPASPNDNLSWIRRPEAVRRLKASGIREHSDRRNAFGVPQSTRKRSVAGRDANTYVISSVAVVAKCKPAHCSRYSRDLIAAVAVNRRAESHRVIRSIRVSGICYLLTGGFEGALGRA